MSRTGSGVSLIAGHDQQNLTPIAMAGGETLTFTHNLNRRAYQVIVSDGVNGTIYGNAGVTVTQTANAVVCVNNLGSITVFVAIRWENPTIELDLLASTDPRIVVA